MIIFGFERGDIIRALSFTCLVFVALVSCVNVGDAQRTPRGGRDKIKEVKLPAPSKRSLSSVSKVWGLKSRKDLLSLARQVGNRCVLQIDLANSQVSCLPVARARSKHGFKFCQVELSGRDTLPSCAIVPQLDRVNLIKRDGRLVQNRKFLPSKSSNTKPESGDTIKMPDTSAPYYTSSGGVPYATTRWTTFGPNANGYGDGGVIPCTDGKRTYYESCKEGERECICSITSVDFDNYKHCSRLVIESCRDSEERPYLSRSESNDQNKKPECGLTEKLVEYTEMCTDSDPPESCEIVGKLTTGVKKTYKCESDPDKLKDDHGCKPGEQWKCDVEPCEYENGRPDPSGRCVPCQANEQATVVKGSTNEQCNNPDYYSNNGAYDECYRVANKCVANLPANEGKSNENCPNGSYVESLRQCHCGGDIYVGLGNMCITPNTGDKNFRQPATKPTNEPGTCLDTKAEYVSSGTFCRCPNNGPNVKPDQLCPPAKGPNENCSVQEQVGTHPNSTVPIYLCACEAGYVRVGGTCTKWPTMNSLPIPSLNPTTPEKTSWFDNLIGKLRGAWGNVTDGLSDALNSLRNGLGNILNRDQPKPAWQTYTCKGQYAQPLYNEKFQCSCPDGTVIDKIQQCPGANIPFDLNGVNEGQQT